MGCSRDRWEASTLEVNHDKCKVKPVDPSPLSPSPEEK